jgi:DNA-binding XRE family transcriptional regulator
MDNFFKTRRDELKTTQRAIAIAADVTEKTVANWENDAAVPSTPIATLAAVYDVTETKMEREVMALRRRIEAQRFPDSVRVG